MSIGNLHKMTPEEQAKALGKEVKEDVKVETKTKRSKY